MSNGHYGCLKCGREIHRDHLCDTHWNQERISAGSNREICQSNTSDLLEITGIDYEAYWEGDEWVVEIFDDEYAEVFDNSTRIIALNTGKPVHECQVAAAFIFGVNLGALTLDDLEEEISPEVRESVRGILDLFPTNYREWEL